MMVVIMFMNLFLIDYLIVFCFGLSCFFVEDSLVICENLIVIFEEMLGMWVVGVVEDEYVVLCWLQYFDSVCDLMIIDIFLKIGIGLEVFVYVKVLCLELKLVVLMNYVMIDMWWCCMMFGVDCVFDKLVELEELLVYCEIVFEWC